MKYLHATGRKTAVKDGETLKDAAQRLANHGAFKRTVVWTRASEEKLIKTGETKVFLQEETGRVLFMELSLKETEENVK